MPIPDQPDLPERIAIVGVGGIFPDAPDLDTFWNNVAGGVDCGRHVPEGRWYLSPEKAFAPWPPQPDRVYSTWGCFIEGFQFDPEGLNLDRSLLEQLDPMFHLGLHAARAAYRDSKQLAGIDHSRVGVILGNIALPTESTSAICRDVLGRTFVEKLIDEVTSGEWRGTSARKSAAELKATLHRASPPSNLLSSSGTRHSSLDTRHSWHPLNRYAAGLPSSLIAEGLGLGGIAFTLDAACASSLYALKFASEELLAHRADAMLAGGMSRPDCQYTQMGFAQLQALSKSGRCAPLSGEADGLVVGEGAGVFVLKRLSDAVAAGDHIYGVIAGIGLSNDRGANLLAPHSEGQLRAMRSAYEQAGWQPSDVDLIECHATGTPVGDAVEIESLHQLWQHETAKPQQCVIGGVKSNVGHLLTGAGAAGLMKVLFALKHRTLPPTANYRRSTEKLAAPNSPFRVLGKAEPWLERSQEPRTKNQEPIPRRATINAFGFGGINAHVLIEEWCDDSRDATWRMGTPARPLGSTTPLGLITQQTHGEGEGEERTGKSAHPPTPVESSVAVVGIAAHAGAWETIQTWQEREFQGKSLDWTRLNWWGVEQSEWFGREGVKEQDDDRSGSPANDSSDSSIQELPVPTSTFRPMGRGIQEVRMPMGQFRIPPLEMQDMLPQQQLMLKVAAEALRDAAPPSLNPQPSTLDPSRTGVFIGTELDPNTTNFHLRWSIEQDAPRWAEMLGLDLTPEELAEWTKQLKDAAGPPLTPNRVMGNLGGIVASRLAREFDVGGPSFTISAGGDGGGVAFHVAVGMLQRGELDRALVGAVDLPCDVRSLVGGLERDPQDGAIAFILERLEDAHRKGTRVLAVFDGAAYRSPVAPPTGISSRADVHRSTRNVIDQIEQHVPSAERRDYSSRNVPPFRPEAATASAFELWRDATDVRTSAGWREPLGKAGRAAFVFPGSGNAFVGMGRELLEKFPEVLRRQEAENKRLRDQYRPDLIWEARTSTDLLANHKAMIFGQVAIGTAVCDLLALFGVRPSASIGYSLGESAALFGLRAWTDRDEMLRRMEESPLFGSDLVAPFDAARKAWNVPDGKPVDWVSGVIDRSADEVRAAIGNVGWDQRRVAAPAHHDARASDDDGPALAASLSHPTGLSPSPRRGGPGRGDDGVAGVDPQSAPLPNPPRRGEGTGDEGRSLRPLRIGAAITVVADAASVGSDAGSIRHDATVIAAPRVYLLIVNTPTQCVIGGERSAVEQFVRDLAATFVPFAAPSTVHCEILREEEAKYRELHLMRTFAPRAITENVSSAERRDYSSPVAPPTGRDVDTTDSAPPLAPQPSSLGPLIDFYSTARGHKYDLNRESAAEAIVAQAVGTIDFPRVIEQAYADGVRVFVEIGPGSSCTKMIDEILGDRPHLARSALPNTSRPVETFLELLAALISEGVPVDLAYLYGEGSRVEGRELRASEDDAKTPAREIVTRVGGLPFEIPTPPGGWRFREPTADETASFNRVGNAPRVECETTSSCPTTHGALPTRLNEDVIGTRRSTLVTQHSSLLAINPQLSTLNPQLFPLNLFNQLQLMTDHRTQAHDTFLRFADRAERLAAQHLAVLAQARATTGRAPDSHTELGDPGGVSPRTLTFDVKSPGADATRITNSSSDVHSTIQTPQQRTTPPRSLNRDECMTFAIGRIGDCLGTMFAEIDQHPTRVRLPDEPLMLVDRILTIEGEPLSMTSGRVVTEHDIHPGAWYLDCGRIPTCIAVESGQADLFLSGWLGIDFITKGLACYRLLDAVVTFHDELPRPGQTINYDIRVLHFFRQGETYLFRFEFDATVDGQPLMTMSEGCAGFFTQAELAGGKGIIHTALDKRPRPGKRPADWSDPVPMAVESYDDSQLLALRQGDLAACFGPAFAGLPLREPVTIPGLMSGEVRSAECGVRNEKITVQRGMFVRRGSPDPAGAPTEGLPLRMPRDSQEETFGQAFRRGQETRAEQLNTVAVQIDRLETGHLPSHSALLPARSRMWLIDRVLKLDPVGGKFGMGSILGELDIQPDDWFLTCHFCDDQVMPGTLMYECCMHTLRIFLLRMGWVGEAGQIAYQPIEEVRSRLKCRGQVLSSTKKVWYEVTLKEVGYGPDAYCMADALMYADGKPIVEITDMSVSLTGLSREKVELLWSRQGKYEVRSMKYETNDTEHLSSHSALRTPHSALLPTLNTQPSTLNPSYDLRPAIFNTDRITAFAIGKPSEAFGDKYRVFDTERKIARLPGPPFQFLDRVVSIENCQPWKLEAGGEIVAQYDIPIDAWYFAANRQPTMPFAVLLETALQPCGWLAGYLGSALTSETDLSFRNLGGKAIQYRDVTPQSGTLTTKVKITKVSQSGGMIIQNFDYHLSCNGEPVYVGDTYFGFFSKESLANQVGIRDAKVFVPSTEESARASHFDAPDVAPFANSDYMMVDNAELLLDSGPHGLGYVRGTMQVDPSAWFFKAHFYEDPVVPGSLGLESFFQLMKFYAAARWGIGQNARFQTPSLRRAIETATPTPHEWVYRGQVIPANHLVTVTAVVTEVDDAARQLTAEGFLSVDGRVIYQMKKFTVSVT